MEKIKRVKQILDNAVNNQNFASHGPFWRNLSRDQFVARRVFGRQLLIVGTGNDSNLVKALNRCKPIDSVAQVDRLTGEEDHELRDELNRRDFNRAENRRRVG